MRTGGHGLQVRTQYAVLPADHPQATANHLERAITAVEGEGSPEMAATVLRSMMEDEDAAFYSVRFRSHADTTRFCVENVLRLLDDSLKALRRLESTHWVTKVSCAGSHAGGPATPRLHPRARALPGPYADGEASTQVGCASMVRERGGPDATRAEAYHTRFPTGAHGCWSEQMRCWLV